MMPEVADRPAAAFPIRPPGVWLELRIARLAAPRPALFLDRDGVIVRDMDYLRRVEDVELLPGAARLIAAANRAGLPVLVVTNQSGVERGLFGWDVFAAIDARMNVLLAEEDAVIDAVAACPFHPDFTPDFSGEHEHWRKPGPGMVTALIAALGLSAAGSWMVGDRRRDIEAARGAELSGGILLDPDDGAGLSATDGFRMVVAPDCDAARAALIAEGALPAG
jgi:D-glycero-D-manno-heptose 1,7-bisphosphate phosphatase